jgi:hypothetical protein
MLIDGKKAIVSVAGCGLGVALARATFRRNIDSNQFAAASPVLHWSRRRPRPHSCGLRFRPETKHDFQMTQNPITTETTVGEIVRAMPARSRVFDRLGIDYCCGGKKPLAEVCRNKGLDATTIVAMLAALDDAPPDGNTANPDTLSLVALCDHIEHVHHAYLRQELPRLDFMTRNEMGLERLVPPAR